MSSYAIRDFNMPHHYRPATLKDCHEIAPNMRSQDAMEIMYSHGSSPLGALQESYKHSKVCNAIVHEDGSVVGMYGLVDSGVLASPWLLGTDKLLDTKRVMLPAAKVWVEEMLESYPLLTNFVHADNTVSKRWLKSLGFEFIKLDKEHGVGKQPFYQFVRIKKNV